MEVERAAMRLSMPYIQRSGIAMGPMVAVILISSKSVGIDDVLEPDS